MPDPAASALLSTVLPAWQQQLQAWAADGRLGAAAREALQLQREPRRLRRLLKRWAHADFRDLPPVVLLSASDMPGAMGAYAISTGTIYLNQEWLLGASQEQVIAVLTEELGHHLDGVVNEGDTPGDEGELFSELLTRTPLANGINAQDNIAIQVNELAIEAEAALISPPSVTAQKDAIVLNQSINLISVDHGWGSAWWNTAVDLTKDWSTSFIFAASGGSGTSDGYTFAINGDPRGLQAIGDGGGEHGLFWVGYRWWRQKLLCHNIQNVVIKRASKTYRLLAEQQPFRFISLRSVSSQPRQQ